MKLNLLIITALVASLMACNGDGNKSASADQELPPEKKAYYEEHGMDDGHNHDKAKAIENNTRSSIPVERKVNTGFTDPPNNPTKTKEQMRLDARDNMKKANRKVPDACTLLNEKQIAKVIGVDAQTISLKDGSSQSSPYARACFFRWEHRGVPNSGVLVQVQDNPLPDEFQDWAAYYIQAKKNEGEKTPDGSMEFKYSDFPGIGVDGAYNYDLHRYMWRDNQDFVYMIAFNLPASEDEEVDWALKLGKIVMDNVN